MAALSTLTRIALTRMSLALPSFRVAMLPVGEWLPRGMFKLYTRVYDKLV